MTRERFHALDGLRALAMLLGMVLHGAAPLVVAPIPWHVRDASASIAFDVMLGFIHGFRMPVFFFLAGFFAHMLWQRLGTRAFLRQRGVRIGIPLVVGMLTIVPLMIALWKSSAPELSLTTYPTAHLWFLEMLLVLYAGATLVAWLAPAALAPRVDAAFDWCIRRSWKPVLLVPPTMLALWNGPAFGEVDEMGWSILLAPRAVAYFGLFFAVGWWLHRRVQHLDALGSWLKTYFAAAVVAFLVLGACHSARSDHVLIKIVALAAASLFAWTMTFALAGWFMRYANRQRSWMRYLADASYWLYLAHLPLVMWLQAMVAAAPVNGWLKLAFILAVTLAVLLPLYHWCIRFSWVGRILNGPRVLPALE